MDRKENLGEFFDEGGLLIEGEVQVPIALLGGSERGKDAACDAKVGLPHVRTFFRVFEAEGNAAEIVYGHASPTIL